MPCSQLFVICWQIHPYYVSRRRGRGLTLCGDERIIVDGASVVGVGWGKGGGGGAWSEQPTSPPLHLSTVTLTPSFNPLTNNH